MYLVNCQRNLVESTTKGRVDPDGSGELGLYRKTENDYVLKHITTGNELNDLSLTAEQLQLKAYRDNGDSIFPMPVRTEQFFYEGDDGQYIRVKGSSIILRVKGSSIILTHSN